MCWHPPCLSIMLLGDNGCHGWLLILSSQSPPPASLADGTALVRVQVGGAASQICGNHPASNAATCSLAESEAPAFYPKHHRVTGYWTSICSGPYSYSTVYLFAEVASSSSFDSIPRTPAEKKFKSD